MLLEIIEIKSYGDWYVVRRHSDRDYLGDIKIHAGEIVFIPNDNEITAAELVEVLDAVKRLKSIHESLREKREHIHETESKTYDMT